MDNREPHGIRGVFTFLSKNRIIEKILEVWREENEKKFERCGMGDC